MLSPDEMNVILLEEKERQIQSLCRLVTQLLKWDKSKPLTKVQLESLWEAGTKFDWADPKLLEDWARVIEKAHGIK
jgi:hypothetical protein